MKAPKGVPLDEIYLAIALQEANARGLTPTMGEFFLNKNYDNCRFNDPNLKCCCAVGALVLAGVGRFHTEDGVDLVDLPPSLNDVVHGNDDCNPYFKSSNDDLGETLGLAFQFAMDGIPT